MKPIGNLYYTILNNIMHKYMKKIDV